MTISLAKKQLLLCGIGIIFEIIAIIIAKQGGHTYTMFSIGFTDSWQIMGLIGLIIGVASIVVGIFQIIDGSKESNGIAIAAGIAGVLAIVPFAGLVGIILNIIIVNRK